MTVRVSLSMMFACMFVWAEAVAQQTPKIGLLHAKSGAFATGLDLSERLGAQLKKLGQTVEVIEYDTESKPDVAGRVFEELVKKQNVRVVIGPESTSELLAIADRAAELKVAVLGLAAVSEPAQAVIRKKSYVVAFGPVPRLQQQIVTDTVTKGAYKVRIDRAAVIGGEAAPASFADLDKLRSGIAVTKYPFGDPTRRLLTEELTRYNYFTGIAPEPLAEDLVRRLASRNSSASVVLFSPPPIQTRLFILGQILGAQAKRGGAKSLNDPDAVLKTARGSRRFDPDQGVFELNWTIIVHNGSEVVQARLEQADAGQRTNTESPRNSTTSGETSTKTQDCSCKNKDGKARKCKDCGSKSCKVEKNNTDDCTAECT